MSQDGNCSSTLRLRVPLSFRIEGAPEHTRSDGRLVLDGKLFKHPTIQSSLHSASKFEMPRRVEHTRSDGRSVLALIGELFKHFMIQNAAIILFKER
jgi:hypothetical protein